MSYPAPDYLSFKPGHTRRKKMPQKLIDCVAATVKALLHAHRDEMRNQDRDTRNIRFDCRSGYYGEAFGILRTLEIQGYGYFGASNIDGTRDRGTEQPEQNLRWWFCELESEVLEEENFRGSGQCIHCSDKYRKDDASYFARLTEEARGEPKFGKDGRFIRPVWRS